MATEWLLCWRFPKSLVNKRRVIVDRIFRVDKEHTFTSRVPKELRKYRKLFKPQVFDSRSKAEDKAREVMKKVGFRYFGAEE